MKAMMIKDLNFLKGQKQFFGALLIMVILFAVVQNNPSFSISYVTIMFSILSLTTMSYDDYENGMCYLLTLPISRREYVKGKYLFGILSALCGLAGASLLVFVSMQLKGMSYPWEEWKAVAIACIILITATLAFTTPIQLKFGAEKSRMAIMGVYGAGGLVVFALWKLCEALEIDLEEVMDSAFVENITTTVLGIVLSCSVILFLSYLISVRVLEKREF